MIRGGRQAVGDSSRKFFYVANLVAGVESFATIE
jgi:hypothetical protein